MKNDEETGEVTRLGAEEFVPDSRSLRVLRESASSCRGCQLYRAATQTIFGQGARSATLMLIGEQPGDHEDDVGVPFVGPAGKLLHRALDAAGIEVDSVYLTNAVKHFKFVAAERGKRRIHKKPARSEITACRPWLVAEIEAVRPDTIVCLGASAAQSLFGWDFRVTERRGEPLHCEGLGQRASDPVIFATMHPSAILRGPAEERRNAFEQLVCDLKTAAQWQ